MPLNSRNIKWIQLALLVFAAAWIAGTAWLSTPGEGGRSPSPRAGFPAPSFTLTNLEGDPVKLSDYQGKVVLLNFWAAWCPPCKAEMPAFDALQQAYQGDDLVILAVNTTYQDDLAAAQEFVVENNLSFPVLLDMDGKVSNAYQILAMPSTFFIDRDGIIQQVIIGGPMSETLIQTQVRKLLAEVP